jgi:endonuclease I
MHTSLLLKRNFRFVINGKFLIIALLFGFSSLTYATIPPNYYDGAIGKSGQTLQVALYNIILGHTAVSYTPGVWNAYYTTDLKGDGTIWDMYSDVPGGTPAYTFLPGTDQCGISYVEGSCYSREHSFPKSYFNSGTPMYTDLHHLFPVDQYVNGTGHNNYPYGTVASPASYTSSNGSKRGPCSYPGYTGTVFEPIDAYKGDFARAYFYMATRYQNLIAAWPANDANADAILNGTSYPAYESWFLNLLLAWNTADPVSAKEIARNDAIYAIQHNRNPFIDHPEYVAAVWSPGGLKGEPSNHPTNYLASAGSPSYSSIILNWTDATGAVLPDGYLVKGSTVSFAAITNPADHTAEADGGLIKNVSYGTHAQTFTGLTASTTYYFKVYSYTNSGTDIDYKTDGVIQTASLATTAGTSVLQPGDIAIIEADATDPDRVSFVALKQISAGTVFNFTDNGFINASTVRTGEGIIVYTAPTVISAGTVISYYNGMTMTGTGWSIGSGSFLLNASGDQVFAFQGTWGTNQIVIYGVNTGGPWISSGIASTSTSYLPSNLTNNLNAIELTAVNGFYNWITSGSSSVIGNIIPNPDNWTTSAGNLASPAWSFNLNSTSTTINKNTTVKYLTIPSGETLTIASTSQLTVTGTLTNAVPSGLVINSDASGTGSLIHSSDFVPATVNRYLPGASWAWHLLASPVSQGIEGSDLVPSGSGYDLYCYDEPTNKWINYKNTSVEPSWNTVNGSEFIPGRGYMAAYETANPTKQFTGLLNNGTISFDLTKSGSNEYNGYNLAGNPYPSSIDWKAVSGWTRSDLALNSGGYDISIFNSTAGNYGVFNSAGLTGTNGATQFIAPGQAFFVKASTTGSLSMTNSVRLHNNAAFLKETDEIERFIRLKIISLATNYSDEVILEFGHESYGGSEKMTGYTEKAPSLMLPFEGTAYAIRFMQNTDDEHLVPLRFVAGENGGYAFQSTVDATFFRMAQLEDVMTGQIYDLKSQSEILLSATKDDPADRFVLHLGLMGTEEHTNNELLTAYMNGKNLQINNLIGKGKVSVFDLQGRMVQSITMTDKGLQNCPVQLPAGVYVVRLQSENAVKSVKVVVSE